MTFSGRSAIPARSRDAQKPFRLGLLLAVILAAIASAPDPARSGVYASPQAIEADFQQGLRALSSGDPRTAIRLFRAILAEHPNLPRVRLELARAHYVAGEWERSRRAFVAVLSGEVPARVKANILRFLHAIDARRGFDWNLSLGFATAPDARRDYDTDTVSIEVFGISLPFEIERESDGSYGVTAQGDAEYRIGIPGTGGDGPVVTPFAGAFFDLFEGEGDGADDYLFGVRAGLRAAWPQATLSASPFVSMRHFGGQHLEDRFGLESGVEWRNAAGLLAFASGSVGAVDDHPSNLRDGTFGSLRLGVARSLAGRALAGVALNAEILDAEARSESFREFGGELFGRADLGRGLDLDGRVYLLNRAYRGELPLLLETRDAWEYGIDVGLTKSDLFLLGQFTPFVKAGYSRRSSAIDAFSYREVRFEVGFRKAF